MLGYQIALIAIVYANCVESCLSTSGASNRYEQIYESRKQSEKLGKRLLIDDEAKEYLVTFGYLRPTSNANVPIKGQELKKAVTKFQKFAGISQSGILDDATREAMLLKRCALKDISDDANYALGKDLLWNKLILSWNISTFPINLPKSQTRVSFERMFEVWRRHTLFDFTEVGDKNKADIAITFDSASSRWPRDTTHTAIAFATGPRLSRISLNNDTNWSYSDQLSQNSTDIIPVILHTIGHILGLGHSNSPDSIMHPIFEHQKPLYLGEGTQSPKLSDVDVAAIRRLYGLSAATTSVKSESTTTIEPHSPPSDEICPGELESATEVNGETYLFRHGHVWRLRERNLVEGAVHVSKLFPDGPSNVNVSITRKGLTVLIHERTLYGYLSEENANTFRLSAGWPKQLHEQVAFTPQAAFPLSNGSVILLSGSEFATYDFDLNRPSLLGNRTISFPTLPTELRAGVLLQRGSDDLLRLFSSDTVYEYDSRIHEIISSESLKTYVLCTNSTPRG